MKKRFFILGIAVLSFFALFFFKFGSAATVAPELMLTWRAKSYVPSAYGGKILPTTGSQITASLEVVEQGKVVDISGQTIYWYADDLLIGGGKGVQTITFKAIPAAPDTITLRATLPSYRGTEFIQEAFIPVMQPKVVIEAPYSDDTFSGNSFQAVGRPYFFSVTDPNLLSLSWNVSGKTPTSGEQPDTLNVNVDPNTTPNSAFSVIFTAQNSADPSEAASKMKNFVFTK